MFDIGFWELGVIMVVGLVVIGPDKLPGIARSAGKWVGKARYFIASVKQDVTKELRAEELKQAIERDAGLDEIKQIMNTDQFTLEEEGKNDSAYLVNAIDDEVDDHHIHPDEDLADNKIVSAENILGDVSPSPSSEDDNSVNKNNT